MAGGVGYLPVTGRVGDGCVSGAYAWNRPAQSHASPIPPGRTRSTFPPISAVRWRNIPVPAGSLNMPLLPDSRVVRRELERGHTERVECGTPIAPSFDGFRLQPDAGRVMGDAVTG